MIIFGKNVVEEALRSGRKVAKIYLDNKFTDHKFINYLNSLSIEIVYTDKGELNNLTNNGNHQGVVAEAESYKYYQIDEFLSKYSDDEKNIIILDEIQDPHNLGSIIRTAEASGIKTIIVGKNYQASLTSVVAKVSAGALEHVKIVQVTNINQAIMKLKEHSYWVIGTSLKTDNDYRELDLNMKKAFVFGNEGKGLRKLVERNCDILVKIPMLGKVNSLNVGVAVGIVVSRYID